MTKPERTKYILAKLSTALRAILKDPRYDWSRNSQAVCGAASTLMEQVQEFIEGKCDESALKPLYKQYVAFHLKSVS